MAVFPPPDAAQHLRRALPATARLTRVEKWHVTLLFLGDASAPAVAAALDSVDGPGPFSLRLAGAGRFGEVAWAGVQGDLEHLASLQAAVRASADLGRFGYAAGPADRLDGDDRPFTPHLTVSYRADAATRQALAAYEGPPWPVTSFALVESHNGQYDPLHTWPVQPHGDA